MARPLAPIIEIRMAARFRMNGHSIPQSLAMAGEAIRFVESAGLEIVMPSWVTDERSGRTFSWEDIPIMVAEYEDRAPWKPYEKS